MCLFYTYLFLINYNIINNIVDIYQYFRGIFIKWIVMEILF